MFNPDRIIEEASEKSGYEPRGMTSFREGLDLFVDDFNRATAVTDAGRHATHGWLIGVLGARFAIEDWLRQHPELNGAPVRQPVFIVGLPRAGTTLLMNLLAKDTQHRFYWNWEANREVPPAVNASRHDDPRVALKIAEVNAALASGALDPRHHVELGDEPTECGAGLLAQDFKSYLWVIQAQVPRYFDWWLEQADMEAAFRYHKRGLQLMQSASPGRWILKHPSHALFTEEILRVYPDARFIVTHREPAAPVASSCDIIRHTLLLGSSSLDMRRLGEEVARLQAESMRRLSLARDANPATPFYDFHYDRFMADPMLEIARIYDFIGDRLSVESEAAMGDALAASRLARKGQSPHRYRLEDYGLSERSLAPMFEDYLRRYGPTSATAA